MNFPSPSDIIENHEIERVHANANFGNTSKRKVVEQALLKCACGYKNGHTAQRILAEHGLIRERSRRGTTALTERGRKYLFAAFGRETNG